MVTTFMFTVMKIPELFMTGLTLILVEFLLCSLPTDPFETQDVQIIEPKRVGEEVHTLHVYHRACRWGHSHFCPRFPSPCIPVPNWEHSTIDEALVEDAYSILKDGTPSS